MKICSTCLALETRPRISFDEEGRCNACVWAAQKKTLDWGSRNDELLRLLEKHRGQGAFDCIVPVSGGKDGSYVAYRLKNDFGMRPLCVTVSPPLPLELGERNLRNFRDSGFDHISVSPNPETMRTLCKVGFETLGFPYYGWLVAIFTSVARIATNFDIGLIFYGEDGEVEYGGSTETKTNPIYNFEYEKRIYLEGGLTSVIENAQVSREDEYWFSFPALDVHSGSQVDITHWSYFENWDPYRNYLVAKEKCGLEEADETNPGTFTNFAQNDQALYALHAYVMYLKYGFGRANQDACIEIRRGSLDRDQGKSLVEIYDGNFPEEFLESYLDYFRMSEPEFMRTLDKFAQPAILKQSGPGRWLRDFEYA